MNTAFVNGEFLQATEAKISIFDRGFLFGDSLYEVLPVYNGQTRFVDRHLARLNENLEKIKISLPNYDWPTLIERLVAENGGGDLQVYIQVTRGNQGARKHDIPTSLEPSVIGFTIHNAYPTYQEKEKGLSAELLDDIRWLRCDIKTTSLLGNILLNNQAVSSGYQTSILVRDGLITEGSTSNVFIVTKDGKIKTPPLDHLCLPGITRQIAIELMQELSWSIYEETFSIKDLLEAEEVWIASTTKEIYPVTMVGHNTIGTGKAGNYWRTIEPLYKKLVSSPHD